MAKAHLMKAKKGSKYKSNMGSMYQPTREQFLTGGGKMYGPTRRHFRPEAQSGAAIAAKKVADACAKKLSALKKEVLQAEKSAKRCAGKLKKTRTAHAAPHKTAKKARKKSSKKSHGEKTVKLADLLGKGKRKHSPTASVKASSLGGKRWSCGGPVRSGCGGSGSRVLNKKR